VTRDELKRRTLAAFRTLPRRERMHVRGRWKSCPVPAVDAEVPLAGRVLEVGCGHGLVSTYLALASPSRAVTGIDIDLRKIDLAQRAAAELGETRPTFHHAADGDVPVGPWDAIVIVDVLYLLPRHRERVLLDECVASLATGGLLVIKETDITPRWKHRLAVLQEVIATRVLRITAGADLTFTPVSELAAHLRLRGLEVRSRRVDRGYLHPHALIVARKPGSAHPPPHRSLNGFAP
jgi:2-polyprenyl-3-methyl-5-hydroxy-6-metoxy-1,4-benzoquinol methylase